MEHGRVQSKAANTAHALITGCFLLRSHPWTGEREIKYERWNFLTIIIINWGLYSNHPRGCARNSQTGCSDVSESMISLDTQSCPGSGPGPALIR